MRPRRHSDGRPRLSGLVLVLLLFGAGCGAEAPPTSNLAVTSVLGGAPDPGFARVTAPRAFGFPADHGPHPHFKTEWWYVTANVRDADGRAFGLQFTIFRSALRPPADRDTVTAWSSPQVYMAHVGLTDETAGRFDAEEHFQRDALGLAGATASPFRVWLESIELASVARDTGAPAPDTDGIFPLRLRTQVAGSEVELMLRPVKPMVLQGDRGFSPKGPGPGDASHYYSYTRLAASGTIRRGGEETDVEGTAWFDREWSTSVLSREQTGWDWLAVQLDDGRDVMVFELRSERNDPHRDGIVVDPDGSARRLGPNDFTLRVLEHWASPEDGTRYPSGWELRIPDDDIAVSLVPLLDQQEHLGVFRYWEGAVRVEQGGRPAGVGYVELTGYAAQDNAPGR